jgi:hypothetical protein
MFLIRIKVSHRMNGRSYDKVVYCRGCLTQRNGSGRGGRGGGRGAGPRV